MMPMRRLAFLALAGGVQAQGDFPNKPIKLVVPYAPRGLPETMARIVAQRVTESAGQVGSTSQAYPSLIRSDIERYAKVVKLSGAKFD
jgi:tripartite-type tricarboxylate transporter receptor subunit TctC